MALISCPIPHTLYLILPPERLVQAHQDYPEDVPTLAQDIELDFRAHCTHGPGVAALVGRSDERFEITFCVPPYEVYCRLTSQEDAYYVQRISPLTIRTHNRLARGALNVLPNGWRVLGGVSELNRQVLGRSDAPHSGYQTLLDAWAQVRREPSAGPAPAPTAAEAPMLNAAQQSFLADMETLIELARQVELDQAALRKSAAVTGVEPVARARLSGDFYRFRLAVPAPFTAGDYVWAGAGEPGQRGAGYQGLVAEISDDAVLIRFHQSVDLARLQQVEWLLPFVSTKQYDIQLDAVRALKEGRSLNPHLLQAVVDGQFIPYDAPEIQQGSGRLNPTQRTMIERALRVPDLLLALGPPGTGKTHTIREIVTRETASRGGPTFEAKKRVLITSQNNRAVDNVLEGLKDVDALRIGREEAISPEVRPLMIDSKAQSQQQKILAAILPTLENWQALRQLWPQVEDAFRQLGPLAAELRARQAVWLRQRESVWAWQKQAYEQVAPRIDRHARRRLAAGQRAGQAARRAEALRQRMEQITRLARMPLIGCIFVLWGARLYDGWQAAFRDYQNACVDLQNDEIAIQQLWKAYRQHAAGGSEVLRQKRLADGAEAALELAHERFTGLVTQVEEITGRFAGAPLLRNAGFSPAELQNACQSIRDWNADQMRRRQLLEDWQTLLQTRRQALYTTLISMADVVGATCIGVATDARFDDLDFDLVIADEAGQIQAMNLLVPLVRARRAVLVGDHQQLPPVVDPAISHKIDPEDDELRPWLEKSLFERLFGATPLTHKVMLDTQYRMPQMIADFISAHFYENRYRTGSVEPGPVPFFESTPMVFIDTVRESNRRDRGVPSAPGEEGRSFINELEAGLIADLALAYQDQNSEWGVIVPYKRQAERIRTVLLRRRREFSQEELEQLVATVDSFQGKERNVIIFGFTRSNLRGSIGFLYELRRLNVSLTRARRQLILVGDSGTLTQATDRRFALLIQSMLDTIRRSPRGYLYAHQLPDCLRSPAV